MYFCITWTIFRAILSDSRYGDGIVLLPSQTQHYVKKLHQFRLSDEIICVLWNILTDNGHNGNAWILSFSHETGDTQNKRLELTSKQFPRMIFQW